MEIAIIALGAAGIVFAGIALNQAKPTMMAERVPGHPDTFELWNEGPGRAVIVRADVVSYRFPRGAAISHARNLMPGLWIDERLTRGRGPWARGASLDPLRRFELRVPSSTAVRITYRAEGALGSIATDTVVVEGSH